MALGAHALAEEMGGKHTRAYKAAGFTEAEWKPADAKRDVDGCRASAYQVHSEGGDRREHDARRYGCGRRCRRTMWQRWLRSW